MKIIRALVALCVFLLSSYASAAQVCAAYGVATNFDFTVTDSPIKVAPNPKGDGTWPTVRVSPQGAVAWWYSSDGFSWRINFGAASADKLLDGSMVAQISAALLAVDPVAALNALEATLPVDAPELTQIWCPFWNEMVDNKPPRVPYIVAVNGKYLTRPTYPFANGVRGTTSNGTTPVASACNCIAARVTETSTAGKQTLYCSVNSVATSVAICVRK